MRIDGGTAYAKDLGKGKYRLFVPDGASITWLGEVGDKGTRIGTHPYRTCIGLVASGTA